ncbi:MAG: type IX secretion system sortase PorU [Flavobacterium sp.]|nr:type IX secretion system sortase PorU [Candidatus Neoflavobacterium equi]
MNKFFLILLTLFISTVQAQQKQEMLDLEWEKVSSYYIDSISYQIPFVKEVTMEFNPEFKRLKIFKRFDVHNKIDESSLNVKSVVYETLNTSLLGDLSVADLPTSIQPQLISALSRSDFSLTLSFYPIIKDGNQIKRVKKISFTYDQQPPNIRRSSADIPRVVNSVLNTGDFFRFSIQKSGVYKLSRSFLSQLGLNVNTDPRNIKLYGHGGAMLPLSNRDNVPFDLVENAIQFVGEADGVFNDDDYILFYAIGTDQWSPENNTSINLYSNNAYYYVTQSAGAGKRMGNLLEPAGNPTAVFSTYEAIDVHEVDKINLGRLGRKWIGENFNINNVQSFEFDLPNLKLSEPVQVEVNAVAAAYVMTSLKVKANNQDLGVLNFNRLSSGVHVEGYENVLLKQFTPTSNKFAVSLDFQNNGVPSANLYLDFIKLKTTNELKGNKQFKFYNPQQATNVGVGSFQFTNAASIVQIWEITAPYDITYSAVGGNGNFNFNVPLGTQRTYVAVSSTDYMSPPSQSGYRMTNQNLKGNIFKDAQGNFKDVDYVIITPAKLSSQAERLANFHRVNSGMQVKVVDLQSIYNEFSSGQQDIAAIRNFIRYVYFNASSTDKRIKYVNMFGDASFDYKDVVPNNTNIVPVFQSLSTVGSSQSGSSSNFSNYLTYMSDDFFVLMDDDEGNMVQSKGLDIAVGRMVVSDLAQASEMVQKVIDYHDVKSYGRWRNNMVVMSDDIDADSDINLQTDLDFLANGISARNPIFNIKKIHTDSYVQEVTAGGNRYPAAKKEFIDAIESGVLLINYYGHGGENGLAQERLFEITDAMALKNQYKYPLFVTITCEVSRFDNPYRKSAGEYMYWNPKGGAVAMLTTTREIGIYNGKIINQELSNRLFPSQGVAQVSIGEALRLTKNTQSSLDRNVVFCIGDPALFLAIPKPKVVLTAIDDVPVADFTGSLQALSYVKLKGEVLDENNQLMTGYNGDLAIQIYDKEIDRVTLGNDGITVNGVLSIMNFKVLGETIFRGNATVNSGSFEFGFVVPKDIKIPLGKGKVSFYSKTNAPLLDKSGYNLDVVVGGINANAATDNIPPRAKLYMNDESFVNGGITNASPIFLVHLEDENGINTASGIGHDIVAILDGDENNPFILNDYYETLPDDYTKGVVRFPFRNLAVGLHTITFKAWDVYNNFIIAEIQFIVVGDEALTLTNVLNYPNPFVSYTEFWFSHNRPFEPLDVQVQVMTITGKVVKTINQSIVSQGFMSRELKWDGRDDFGDKLAKGVYVYKLTVRSSLTNKRAEKIEKLVIL